MPMFVMGRMTHYRLAGMPMGIDTYIGMALIVGGVLIAGYGLLPRNISSQRAASADIVVAAPEDAQLGPAHWGLMIALVIALVIDVMKPAALGFAVPGMTHEYGVPKATASLVAFFALVGTVVGSVVWGTLADIYGRKATILLSAVLFVGIAICGAMPSLAWNIFMCFMMGSGRRNASCHLCLARRDDAEQASRLEPRIGRRAGSDLRVLDPDGHTFAATGI